MIIIKILILLNLRCAIFRVNLEEYVFRSIKLSRTPSSIDSFDGLIRWTESRQICVIVFAVLTLLILIAAYCLSALLVSVCTTASTNLHNYMFNSISKVTMNFLNKNPSGNETLLQYILLSLLCIQFD